MDLRVEWGAGEPEAENGDEGEGEEGVGGGKGWGLGVESGASTLSDDEADASSMRRDAFSASRLALLTWGRWKQWEW